VNEAQVMGKIFKEKPEEERKKKFRIQTIQKIKNKITRTKIQNKERSKRRNAEKK